MVAKLQRSYNQRRYSVRRRLLGLALNSLGAELTSAIQRAVHASGGSPPWYTKVECGPECGGENTHGLWSQHIRLASADSFFHSDVGNGAGAGYVINT